MTSGRSRTLRARPRRHAVHQRPWYSFSKVLHRVHPGIYEPTATSAPNVAEASEDMARWFQQHPYLETTDPDPVTVGGVKGVRFDVVGKDLPKDYRGVCGTDRVDLVRFRTGPVVSPEGIQ